MGLLDTIRLWFSPKDGEDDDDKTTSSDITRHEDNPLVMGYGRATTMSELEVEYTRQGLYESYNRAELEHSFITVGLNVYADLAGTGSAVYSDPVFDARTKTLKRRQSVYSVRSDSGNVDVELDEVNSRTNLPARARMIIRDLAKHGDRFDELIYNDYGIERMMRLEPGSVRRHEDKSGRLIPPHPFTQKTHSQSIEFERWQIAHYRAGSPDTGYGVENSLLFPLLIHERRLALANTSLILGRLTDPDGRLVVYVDTGKKEAKDRKDMLKRVAQGFTQHRVLDSNGQISNSPNVLRQSEPIFMAIAKERQLTRVEKLPGTSGIAKIADVEYLRDNLLAGIGVSKLAYGLPVPYAVRGAMSEQMKVVQRTARRLRSDFEMTATEVYLYSLLSYGVAWEALQDQQLIYNWPALTHEDDMAYMQLMLLRIEVAEAMQSNGWLPPTDVLVRYLGFAPDEAEILVAQAASQSSDSLGERYRRGYVGGFDRRKDRINPNGLDEGKFVEMLDRMESMDSHFSESLEEVRLALDENLRGRNSTIDMAQFRTMAGAFSGAHQ